MRAVVALGLARHVVLSSASDLSVRSTLAGFQKFTDEMVAKYAQDPTEAPSEDATIDTTQDTVTQVAGAGGEAHAAGVTTEDKQAILDAIAWLEGLQADTLQPAHSADDALQAECQDRLDICEQPASAGFDACDDSGQCVGSGGVLKMATGSHTDMRSGTATGKYTDMKVGILRHAEIGSELSQGTGTSTTFTLGHTKDVLHPGLAGTCASNIIDRSDEDALANQPNSGVTVKSVTAGTAPLYVSTGTEEIADFISKMDPAHFDSTGDQLTDGIGVFSGYFGDGAPWSHAMTDQAGRNACAYMKDLTTGDPATALTNAEDVVLINTVGAFQGSQEFDYDHADHDCCTCGSLYTAKTEFGLRHKACRQFHQKPACEAQKTKCDAYDTCRKSTCTDCSSPNCIAFPDCALGTTTGGDLADEYISVEWWFKERNTMETCLESVQKWFEPLWDKYIICDNQIKLCAEATLTCDNIQKEFEAKHCQWDTARKEACDAHYLCYDLEITRCASTCDLIQQRVTGRKAENEIIERIICMLKALMANNDQHFDSGADSGFDGSAGNLDNSVAAGGTGSEKIDNDKNSDAGTKESRLQACKDMTVDNNGYNIVCQGPKLRRCAEETIGDVTYPVGSFHTGDDPSHYRSWSRADGGEYPRLPMDMNSNLDDTWVHASSWVDTIRVDPNEWQGGSVTVDGESSSEKVGTVTGTELPVHRREGFYTPWGFDCEYSSRPCTHEFVQEHYDFLRTDSTGNMERAPCLHCETSFEDSASTLDVCPDGAGETSCACFVSRDDQFCTECSGGPDAQLPPDSVGYCAECANYCASHDSTAAGKDDGSGKLIWQTDVEFAASGGGVGAGDGEACEPDTDNPALQCISGSCVNEGEGYECK